MKYKIIILSQFKTYRIENCFKRFVYKKVYNRVDIRVVFYTIVHRSSLIIHLPISFCFFRQLGHTFASLGISVLQCLHNLVSFLFSFSIVFLSIFLSFFQKMFPNRFCQHKKKEARNHFPVLLSSYRFYIILWYAHSIHFFRINLPGSSQSSPLLQTAPYTAKHLR